MSCGFRRSAIRHEIELSWYRVCWFGCCGDVAWLPEVHCKFVNRADRTWTSSRWTLYVCQGPPARTQLRLRHHAAGGFVFLGVTKAVTTVTPFWSRPNPSSFEGVQTGMQPYTPRNFVIKNNSVCARAQTAGQTLPQNQGQSAGWR